MTSSAKINRNEENEISAWGLIFSHKRARYIKQYTEAEARRRNEHCIFRCIWRSMYWLYYNYISKENTDVFFSSLPEISLSVCELSQEGVTFFVKSFNFLVPRSMRNTRNSMAEVRGIAGIKVKVILLSLLNYCNIYLICVLLRELLA